MDDPMNPDVRRRLLKSEPFDGYPVATAEDRAGASFKLQHTWTNVDENYLKRWFGSCKHSLDYQLTSQDTSSYDINTADEHSLNGGIMTPSAIELESPQAACYAPTSSPSGDQRPQAGGRVA